VTNRDAMPMSKAKIRVAQRDLLLLGVAALNDWALAQSRFSLLALRNNVVSDETETPPLDTFWCLRNATNRRAVAIFVESLNDSAARVARCVCGRAWVSGASMPSGCSMVVAHAPGSKNWLA
jgi:hypothetical protein